MRAGGKGYFLGRFSEGPDVVSPAIPSDSPRIPINRQSMKELEADRVLRQLTDKLVVDQHGHTFVQSRMAKLKPGQRVVGSAPARVTHEMWRDPHGNVVRHALSAHKALSGKPGWVLVGPEANHRVSANTGDLDVRHDVGAGETMSMREKHEHELEHQARDANAPRQRTGRRFVDGELVKTFDGDDTPIVVPHDQRHDTIDKLDPRGKP